MSRQAFSEAIIVEDHPLTAAALQRFLEDEGDCRIIGHAKDGMQALDLIELTSPGVVFLDITLPKTGGLMVLESIKANKNAVPVVVFSGQATSRQFRDAWALGADALVHKSDHPDCFLKSLGAIRAGGTYISPQISTALNVVSADFPEASERKSLSKREQQVLALLASGLNTRQAAEKLGIAPGTARKHRENIMNKLEARSFLELVREAENLGLLRKPV